MTHSSRLICSLLLVLLTTLAYAQDDHVHTCIHDKLDLKPEVAQFIADDDNLEGRVLQSYQNIRILLDFSTLTGVSTDFKNYVANDLLPPAFNYLQAALKVKPVSGKLTSQVVTTMCSGLITPNSTYAVGNGVDADLVIFLTQTNEPSSSFLAYAGACLLDPVTYRPLFGRLNFNLAKMSATTQDIQIEIDIYTVMHEITHVLGFSDGLYQYYINPSTGVLLTGHIFNKTVNGNLIKVLNLPTLTSKLRTHFNCPTLEGAYIENEGGSGSAGSHFERRVIYNDYMTASAIKDVRVTEFALALLEGTGWYQVDYSLAEPVTYGKNKGCTFLDTKCVGSGGTTTFDEFCSPLTNFGCSWTQRGGAACGAGGIATYSGLSSTMNYWGNNTVVSDTFADNCPNYQIYSNLDCEDSTLQSGATLPSSEFYGYGGKCFMGTLVDINAGYIYLDPWGYCFKKICEAQTGGTYILKVLVGSTNVTCSAAGDVTVPGYSGTLKCPDPTKFCNQVETEGYCKRKCSGRGTCTNKVCQCVDGWTFHDCSKKGYVDNCARCAGGNPKLTSCYGDTCACNPSNITCMCQLGLTTGTACNAVPAAPNVNPTAAFTATKTNLQVSFTGATSTDSDGTIASYAWNFGESSSGASNTATGVTTSHTYAAAGSYTVTLTVTDNQGGTGTTTQTVTVTAANINPTSSFTVTKTNLQISVNGGASTDSDGTIASYAWNFGETSSGASNTATGATATHTYAAAGSYTVTLTVTDNRGGTGTSTQTVTVLAANINPTSSFTVTKTNLQISVNGGASTDSDGTIASYAWNFGESSSGASNTATGATATHTYAAAGSYTVTLTVTDNRGGTGTSTQTVTVIAANINPTSSFTVTKTNLQISVNGGASTDSDGTIASYAWSFGETSSGASNTATGATATHTYAAAGSYTVTLTVTDNRGGTGTSTQTVTVLAANINPTSSFTVTKTNLQISVNGGASTDSDGTIASYAWSFGETSSGASNTATGATATHTYAAAGSYTVTLTVTDNRGGTGTSTQTVTVIAANINPTSSFTVTKTNLQINVNGGASTDSDGTIASYAWNFGESSSGASNTATGATATHTYAASGSYTVTLTVTDNRGGIGTSSQAVSVLAPNINPTAAFTLTKTDLRVSFNGATSVDPDGNIVSYAWNFGESSSGASNTATGATPTHTYAAGGSYTVTLTVTDNRGGTATSTQTVTVIPPNINPTAAFTTTKTNLQANFNGGTSVDPDGTIASYAWNFGEATSGASNTATTASATHTYSASGSYAVSLTVTDNRGGQTIVYQTVSVTSTPGGSNADPSSTFTMAKNNLQVSFNGATSTDSDGNVASYSWNFGEPSSGSSNTATGSSVTHTYATEGSYTVLLIVTDNQGARGGSSQAFSVIAPIISNDGGNNDSSNSSSSKTQKNSFSTGAIIGTAAGGVIAIGGIILGVKYGAALFAKAGSKAVTVIRVTPANTTPGQTLRFGDNSALSVQQSSAGLNPYGASQFTLP